MGFSFWRTVYYKTYKYKYLIVHSPQGFFRDNLQHCVGDFARLLVAQFTSNEVMYQQRVRGFHQGLFRGVWNP